MSKAYTKEEYMKKWPIDEIPDNIRELAVAWGAPFHLFIEDTVKLARDILEATEVNRKDYAKQECIELLNWMFAGAAETIPYPGPNMWLRDLSDEYKDSAALYDAFSTQNKH